MVMDSDPPAPVRRARVSLTAEHLKQPELVDTDLEGRYRFVGLSAGTYRVTASKPGFVTMQAGAKKAGERGQAVELAAGAAVTADVALPRGAAIDGRVINESGEPVHNAILAAVRFEDSSTGRRTVAVRETRTDDLGRYRLHSLPEGEYYVEASPDARRLAAEWAPSGDRAPGLARTFFPGTVQYHEARALKLARAQQLAGIDFAVATVPLVRVAGRVQTSSGKLMREYSIRLHPVDAPIGSVAGFRSQEGTFEFSAVPAGEYWLLASLLPAPGAAAEFTAQRMRFGSDMQDLTLTTTPGTVLHGRIEAESGALPVLARATVVPVASDFEVPPTRPPAPRIAPAPDGTFTINGLFGPHRFRLDGLPEGWELRRVLLDDRDVTNVVTDFRGSNAPRPLRIVIAQKSAGS